MFLFTLHRLFLSIWHKVCRNRIDSICVLPSWLMQHTHTARRRKFACINKCISTEHQTNTETLLHLCPGACRVFRIRYNRKMYFVVSFETARKSAKHWSCHRDGKPLFFVGAAADDDAFCTFAAKTDICSTVVCAKPFGAAPPFSLSKYNVNVSVCLYCVWDEITKTCQSRVSQTVTNFQDKEDIEGNSYLFGKKVMQNAMHYRLHQPPHTAPKAQSEFYRMRRNLETRPRQDKLEHAQTGIYGNVKWRW